MTHRIRTATMGDLPAIVPLLNAAYGPRPGFESRLRVYLSVQPEGWVVAESPSGLVGVGGFVAFGRCAYVGLMGVSPQAQRRGIGASVFEAILERCERLGIALLLLDASAPGAPLYERYAFRDHGLALAYTLDPRAVGGAIEATDAVPTVPLDPDDEASLTQVAELDARGFGADRSALIRRCLQESRGRAFVARDASSGACVGYAVGRVGSFGPCMARSSEVARALVRRTMALPCEGPVTWLVAPQNPAAVSLAEELGGVRSGTWRHMRRGDPAQLASDWSSLFGKMSLAVG